MSAFGVDIDSAYVCVLDEAMSKEDALNRLLDLVCQSTSVTDAQAVRKAVFEREAVMSTGIGNGVAIPHVRIEGVSEPVIGVALCPKGVDFDAADRKPVRIIVLFAMPTGSHKQYLSLVAQLMLSIKTPEFARGLLACRSREEATAFLNGSGA